MSDSSSGGELRGGGRAWRITAALFALLHAGWIWWLSSDVRLVGKSGPLWGFLSNSCHFALFGVLALLLLEVARRPGGGASREALIGVLILTVTYGIVDEWHQTFVPGRSADPFDVCVDLLGGVGAVCLWWGVRGAGRFKPAIGRAAAIACCAAAFNAWRAWGPLG